MPRPPNIIPPVALKTTLPQDLRAWLDLHLWSESEQRVPVGAYQRLLVGLLTEYRRRVEAAAVTETSESIDTLTDAT